MTEPNDAAPGDEGARPLAYPAQRDWRQRNPVARQAHMKAQVARRAGKLVPRSCEWPGCRETKTEAHHPDYARPLVVKWFCRKHHKAEHRRLRCDAG